MVLQEPSQSKLVSPLQTFYRDISKITDSGAAGPDSSHKNRKLSQIIIQRAPSPWLSCDSEIPKSTVMYVSDRKRDPKLIGF